MTSPHSSRDLSAAASAAQPRKVRIAGLVQLTVRVKPAQKKRKGRSPATGEEITIAAKPAAVDLRARPLAKAKAALPTEWSGSVRSDYAAEVRDVHTSASLAGAAYAADGLERRDRCVRVDSCGNPTRLARAHLNGPGLASNTHSNAISSGASDAARQRLQHRR